MTALLRLLTVSALLLALTSCAATPPIRAETSLDPSLVQLAARHVAALATRSLPVDGGAIRLSAQTPSTGPLVDAVAAALRELGYPIEESAASAGAGVSLTLEAGESDALLQVTVPGSLASRLYTRDATGAWHAASPFTARSVAREHAP